MNTKILIAVPMHPQIASHTGTHHQQNSRDCTSMKTKIHARMSKKNNTVSQKNRLFIAAGILCILSSSQFSHTADTTIDNQTIDSSTIFSPHESKEPAPLAVKSTSPETQEDSITKSIVIEPASAPAQNEPIHKKTKKDPTKVISFRYNNEPLVDIINFLAAKKECNILLPQGAEAITSSVTLSIDDKVSLDQAWELLRIMLSIANYSLLPKGDMYVIKKNTDAISREPGKIYIGTKPENLPNSEEQIQYVYFLANAKASDDANNDLNKLLSSLLPKESYKVDQSTNGIIFSAKANLIKSIMKIVVELDKAGFAEKLAVIRLHHASAELIAKLFTENIIKTTEGFDRYRMDTKKQSDASYFSKSVKIIPDTRTNSLIVLGKAQAVERIQDFIYKYIDVELESGKSILHIYQLQYLEADKAKEALDKVIDSARALGTGQAKGAPLNQMGNQRTFGDVIIQTDKAMLDQGTAGTSDGGNTPVFGGNKLIIAARYDDWRVLKELLEKIDQPQPQVLIEVIIADLTLDDIKQLGSSLRNPTKIPLPGDVQFQAGMAPNGDGLVLDPTQGTPKSINADLLGVFDESGVKSSQAANAAAGSMVFSFNDNDGRTWCFAQILKNISKTKILSAPHVLATNNQEALVVIGEMRNLPDESVGTAGSNTVKNKYVPANLSVKLKPRISSEAQSVSMQVTIDISQYLNSDAANRTTRNIYTNATIHDKDILAIGGLLRSDTRDTIRKTPILGDIPILGWFFKGRNSETTKTNLTVFIQPIIIHPYLRSGVSPETQKYVNFAKASAEQGDLFDSVKDPVTRIFFKADTQDTESEIKSFVEKNQAKHIDPLIMTQNSINQTQVETLITTQLPLKMVPEKTENPATQLASKIPAKTVLPKTTLAKQISATKQKESKSNSQTQITASKPVAGQKKTQIAAAKQPASAEKIKELIKNEPNPLRRVQS